MNRRIMIVLLVSMLILSAVYMNTRYHFKENHLYRENSLPEDPAKGNTQLVTRRVAVQKAYDLFENEYGLNLRSSGIQMYINLYKKEDQKESYCWLMSWYDYEKNETYTFTIDAISGKIVYFYIGLAGTDTATKNPQSLTYQEITCMIEGLYEHIGDSLASYDLEVCYPSKEDGKNYWYQKCKLIDRASGELKCTIKIDSTNKIIREYDIEQV